MQTIKWTKELSNNLSHFRDLRGVYKDKEGKFKFTPMLFQHQKSRETMEKEREESDTGPDEEPCRIMSQLFERELEEIILRIFLFLDPKR